MMSALFFFVETTQSFAIPIENFPRSCLPRALNGILGREDGQVAAPQVRAVPKPRKIENLNDLLQAFSHGLSPDLTNASQRDAFEIYLRMRFGDPNTQLNPGSLDEIAKIIKEHPELEKEAFRDFKLEVQERTYPVTKELATYLDSQVSSAGQTRANFFQVEANSGYWKKVLGYEEPEAPKVEQLARDATPEQKAAFRERAKQQKEEVKAKWTAFLDSKLSPKLRAELQDQARSPKERATALYKVLRAVREKLASQGKDIRPVSQAIVDLIHTIGYNDPVVAKAFKSSNGMERLNAYRRVLDERDRFAMELGFPDHFEQVLRDIGEPAGVNVPNGVPSATGTTETLKELEHSVMAGSQVVKSSSSTRTIRHLSLVESPFRSCLGGSDCSSRTYLTRALDPNYHYFTITDETGASSGHITVVLGDGKLNGKSVKMAFIDKVQNVPNADLPQMVEGVRRSLEERGYKLTVPDDVGDHNGLSNEDITRSFVANSIKKDPDQPIMGFKPHHHSYSFPNKHSRAEQSLPSHAVAPLKLSEGVEITPGELTMPWKTGDLDLNRLVQASVNLKNSPNLEDQLRYLPSMKTIKLAGLKVDPEFDATLAKWMSSPDAPFQLRKQALLFQWTENLKPLSTLLPAFSRSDQVQLLQNLMDTPRYRELILKDKNSVLDLIVTARGNKKVRETLISVYAGGKRDVIQPFMERVLDAHDISDEVAAGLVKQIKTSLGSPNVSGDVEEILKIQKLARGTSLEGWLRDELLTSYASGFNGETSLGRALSRCLNSSDPVIRDFGQRLLSKADGPRLSQFKVVKAFQEITALQHSDPALKDFTHAGAAWMKSEKVNPELKSSFLLTHFGSKDHLYETYRAAIPHDQLPIEMRKVDEATNLGVFERLALREGGAGANPTLRALFENGKLESFEYQPHRFPEGGKRVRLGSPADDAGRWQSEDLVDITLTKPFEMQATPVTQLQWSLVMGENPSDFKTGGQMVKINGKDIPMNPNRPVEQVSWDDVQKYIQKLNQMDPHYNYRLPTEAEWEYAARAGTDTPFSFGSDPNDLGAHGWYSGNSGNQTHDVASLKPNANGLYDMHGNVWEWVQDWFDNDRPPNAVDPTGPAQGTYRVLRGGSWYNDPQCSRSTRRDFGRPGNRNSRIGFRLVRTPK
jgi:formylglycine-generating enzyme required for sulfatase activity